MGGKRGVRVYCCRKGAFLFSGEKGQTHPEIGALRKVKNHLLVQAVTQRAGGQLVRRNT